MLASPKPKSMAEAVAAYAGKKYSSKADKKLKKKQEKELKLKNSAIKQAPVSLNHNIDEDLGEEIGEEIDEKHDQSSSDDDQVYESAVDEVQSDDQEDEDKANIANGTKLSKPIGKIENHVEEKKELKEKDI